MNKKVITWLATYFQTTSDYVDQMLKDEQATSYLLVWPIFEQKLFAGFMRGRDISDAAKNYAPYYQELDVDESAAYFHDRYQDNTKYRNLAHGDKRKSVDTVLAKSFTSVTELEKMELLIYVVYRYRNNIFHGNKGIQSWSSYKTEIQFCMDFMMSLIECAEKHKGELV